MPLWPTRRMPNSVRLVILHVLPLQYVLTNHHPPWLIYMCLFWNSTVTTALDTQTQFVRAGYPTHPALTHISRDVILACVSHPQCPCPVPAPLHQLTITTVKLQQHMDKEHLRSIQVRSNINHLYGLPGLVNRGSYRRPPFVEHM